MELTLDRFKSVCGDTILVREVLPEGKKRGLYVPANAIDNQRRGRKGLWKGEVLKWGPKAELENHTLEVGQVVLLDPVSKDCFGFDEGDNSYRLVKDDDVLGLA